MHISMAPYAELQQEGKFGSLLLLLLFFLIQVLSCRFLQTLSLQFLEPEYQNNG